MCVIQGPPARSHDLLFDADGNEVVVTHAPSYASHTCVSQVGEITSGVYGPSVKVGGHACPSRRT